MRKIVSFREYLGAYQDVDLPLLDLAAHGTPGVAPACAVAIDAQDPRPRELRGERGLDALRTLANGGEVLVAALRASGRQRRLVPAMMAA